MRKTKSYCLGYFKPKKMEVRTKDSLAPSADSHTATFINAPPRNELKQNKRAQVVKNRPVKKPSEIRSFLTRQTIQKKQTFTLH